LPDFVVERSFYASLHSLSSAENSATFYIINTSQKSNGSTSWHRTQSLPLTWWVGIKNPW